MTNDKTKLKEFLVKINKLSESLGSIKETIEGENSMTKEEFEAKLAEEITKAEAKFKTDLDAKDLATATIVSELTKKLEDAEAKVQLTSQEIEKATAAAVATKEQEIKDALAHALASYLDNPLNEEAVASLSTEMDEVEKEIASKYGFKSLVKFASGLAKEAAVWKEDKSKAEASKLAEVRYSELEKLGVAFNGEKASAQKDKVSKMTEEAFASYKDDLQSISSSITSNSDEVLKKAREAAGGKSVTVDTKITDKFDNFNKFL